MRKFLKLVTNKINKVIVICVLLLSIQIKAQNRATFSGDIQLNYQTFKKDPLIGADARLPYGSGYINLMYNYNQFTFGSRVEFYKNPIPGLEDYGKNQGPSNKFLQFRNKNVDVTIGNFYDEFGSGLIFRTYFDSNLGIDNSVNGVRLKLMPITGLYLTGLIGNQRSFWEYGNGLVRALNADISLNSVLLKNWDSDINLGFSFVTKKEEDVDPIYILPENVGAFNGRMNITKGNISLNIDYAYKINDPSADNHYIYKDGNGLIITANYSKKGFGIVLGAKRIENMSFRSERNALLQDLNINYITTFTKQQSYSLASLYPYSSQPNGEMGTQLDVYYTIPKKSKLGGKYGISINFNFSNVFNINKSILEGSDVIDQSGTLGYDSEFLKLGDNKLFQELNLEISKKINRKLKLLVTYINVQNNDKLLKSQPLISGQNPEYIYANIIILEVLYKIKPKHATKFEIQHLQTQQHYGNWVMGLIEYKLSPSWFWSLQDLYNYGNPTEAPHYYSISTGYNRGASRLSLTYGKQRAGLFCVGGICREVPASNGLSISLTSSF